MRYADGCLAFGAFFGRVNSEKYIKLNFYSSLATHNTVITHISRGGGACTACCSPSPHTHLYRPARHRKVFPPFFLLLCSRCSSRQKNSLEDITGQKLEASCSEHGCSVAEEQEKRREICLYGGSSEYSHSCAWTRATAEYSFRLATKTASSERRLCQNQDRNQNIGVLVLVATV